VGSGDSEALDVCEVPVSEQHTSQPTEALPERRVMPHSAKIAMRVLAVCAAILVILPRDGLGPPYIDAAGKVVFWSAGVPISVFSFSRDILNRTGGIVVSICLVALQCILIFYAFVKLEPLNFFVLAGLCMVQTVVFSLPFMLIRKRYSGIWY
jgi:hypothetical protein